MPYTFCFILFNNANTPSRKMTWLLFALTTYFSEGHCKPSIDISLKSITKCSAWRQSIDCSNKASEIEAHHLQNNFLQEMATNLNITNRVLECSIPLYGAVCNVNMQNVTVDCFSPAWCMQTSLDYIGLSLFILYYPMPITWSWRLYNWLKPYQLTGAQFLILLRLCL